MDHRNLNKVIRLLGIILLAAILWASASPETAFAERLAQGSAPAQPTNISVFHRGGQTFLTWSEVPNIVGEKYRIYRHNQPITSGNLNQATLLLEVGEGSSRFFVNRFYNELITQWSYRHSERLAINNLAPPLTAGTGLLVWTVGPEDFGGANQGNGYYAVTTVSFQGVENRTVFSSGNTIGPLAEAVGAPEPVEISHSMGAGWHVYIQYMNLRRWNPTFHAPSNLNSYYGFSSNDVQVTNAYQYAYDYAVYQPGTAECGPNIPQQLPVVLSLHPYRGNNKFTQPDAKWNWCAYQIFPVDSMNTWWFGFARNYNYRSHQPGAFPGAGDVVVNFTEQRLLRMISDLAQDPSGPAVDMNRVFVQGHSMGGSGTLSLALRYGNVFAAADASKPMTNYRTTTTFFVNDISVRWGKPDSNLPVQIEGPNGWAAALQPYNGMSVWDWQNHQQTIPMRPAASMVPFGVNHSMTDSTITWAQQGQPIYAPFNQSRQVWGGEIRQDRHDDASFTGLPPNLARDASNVPFAGLRVVRNESMPGLSNGSANLPVPPTSTGNYNHAVMWSSSWYPWNGPPVETSSSWEISLCSVNPNSTVYACGSGANQSISVTPRRLQVFHPVPGATYSWENRRISDGGLIASGTVTADDFGLLTVPGVSVSPSGVRLRIWSGGPVPTPTFTPVPPTPTATKTNTPVTPPPTATNTPVIPPTATNTPVIPPTATNTPVTPPPTATNTPVTPPPTATNTPVTPPPTATNTPVAPPPTATNTPVTPPPTATNTPVAPPPTATNTPAAPPTATNTPAPPTNTPAPPTSTPTAGAGVTGWHSPSANQPGPAGDRNGFELDVTNIYADDGLAAADMDSGVNAQVTCKPTAEDSHHFYDFNIAVPPGSTVTGVEARLDGWADSTVGTPRFCVSFSWNNGSRWSEYREAQITEPVETTYLLGGPGQTWGSNWLPEHFNNGNFRMRIVMDASTTDRDFYLDWAAVRVYFQ